MKKNKYFISYLIIAGIFLVSCKKNFLDKTPLNFVTPDTYVTNETQAQNLLNGVYNKLNFGGSTSAYQRVQSLYIDCMTDNVYNRSAWEDATDFARGQVTQDNSRVGWKWSENYQGISRANEFLSVITKAKVVSDKIPRYIAEAKFLRAWYYNDLVTFFGDVPLILEVGNLANGQPKRTSKADVVIQILKDLDEATPDLPLTYAVANDGGRITKGAALSLKARVLLYNSRWQEAAVAAKACMDLGVYSLYPDYGGLFKEENESAVTNSEAILQVYYTPKVDPSFNGFLAWWPSYLPTLQLVNSYYMANGLPITDPQSGYDNSNPFMGRDPRFQASIYYPGSQIRSALIGLPNFVEMPHYLLGGSGFQPKKFTSETAVDMDQGRGLNRLFIRYAEVLLTYAEAQNEAVGPDATVYAAIDQLRQRAGMKTLTNAMPGLSKDNMREEIRNERRVEFAFEGLRWADIMRWKIAPQVMVDALGYDGNFFKIYPGDYKGTTADWQYVTKIIDYRSFNPARDYLWPIPRTEVNANKNMVQNPGY